ncbi:hypothetical protein [Melittangium boletus]|uniref:hypothetical protein n=1 Tax=Melittangium boletus TaxID=83453 RepID=UPI003DA45640
MSENTQEEMAGDSDAENQDAKRRVLVHRRLWGGVLLLAGIASPPMCRSSGGAMFDLNGVAVALMWCSVAVYMGLSSRGLRSESMSGLLKVHALAFVLAVPAVIVLMLGVVFLAGA